jgi:hypothetical protein
VRRTGYRRAIAMDLARKARAPKNFAYFLGYKEILRQCFPVMLSCVLLAAFARLFLLVICSATLAALLLCPAPPRTAALRARIFFCRLLCVLCSRASTQPALPCQCTSAQVKHPAVHQKCFAELLALERAPSPSRGAHNVLSLRCCCCALEALVVGART